MAQLQVTWSIAGGSDCDHHVFSLLSYGYIRYFVVSSAEWRLDIVSNNGQTEFWGEINEFLQPFDPAVLRGRFFPPTKQTGRISAAARI